MFFMWILMTYGKEENSQINPKIQKTYAMLQIESSTKTQMTSCLFKSIVICSKNHWITAEGNKKCIEI